MKFPRVTGSNLLGEKVTIPDELPAKFNILIVAFQQWQQRLVNSWVPFLETLVSEESNVDYYELPTIRGMNRIYQRIIDGGMRAGIPNPETRRRTVTLYIDKEPFRDALEIDSEDDIQILLVDDSGEVQWRETGSMSDEKKEALLECLRNKKSREGTILC
ncbi:MAG: hypothetical protein ACFFEF_08255 [Candidatus Thorarchaeota archaeon]